MNSCISFELYQFGAVFIQQNFASLILATTRVVWNEPNPYINDNTEVAAIMTAIFFTPKSTW